MGCSAHYEGVGFCSGLEHAVLKAQLDVAVFPIQGRDVQVIRKAATARRLRQREQPCSGRGA